MLSVQDLIKQFFPYSSDQERSNFLLWCQQSGVEYDEKTWSIVNEKDLSKKEVQLNLVLTLYQSQYKHYGVASSILESLESWSDGVLIFNSLDKSKQEFYQMFYAAYGFQNFPFLRSPSQLILLGTRFLVLGLLWGWPVIENVKKYFAEFCDIDISKAEAERFSYVIFKNVSQVLAGNEYKYITVADWVKAYINFCEKTGADLSISTETFISNEFNNKKNVTEIDQYIIKSILVLYSALASGMIWKIIGRPSCIHESHGNTEYTDPEVLYLGALSRVEDITLWLKSYKDIADWFLGKSESFLKDLFAILKKKIDLSKEEQIQNLLNLSEQLKNKKIIKGDVIFFNESDNQFHWNEDLFKQ